MTFLSRSSADHALYRGRTAIKRLLGVSPSVHSISSRVWIKEERNKAAKRNQPLDIVAACELVIKVVQKFWRSAKSTRDTQHDTNIRDRIVVYVPWFSLWDSGERVGGGKKEHTGLR